MTLEEERDRYVKQRQSVGNEAAIDSLHAR